MNSTLRRYPNFFFFQGFVLFWLFSFVLFLDKWYFLRDVTGVLDVKLSLLHLMFFLRFLCFEKLRNLLLVKKQRSPCVTKKF